MGKIALCADSESLIRPEMIDLKDVDLERIDWVETFFKAGELRRYLRANAGVEELWLFSSDDMDALNLAAALHKDAPNLKMTYIASNASDSLGEHAKSVGIESVIEPQEFALVFAKELAFRSSMSGKHIDAGSGNASMESPTEPSVHDPQSADIPVSGEWARSKDGIKTGQSAFVMSVVSGGGGVGKSVLSGIAAVDAASRGLNTLMIDCDLQFGDMHRIFGIADPVTVDDLLGDADVLAKAIARTEAGMPVIISAPKRLEYCESISSSLGNMVDVLAEAFDVIIMNTGSNWAEHHAALLEKSSCALFLMDQRASSVRACQHAVDLCMRMGIATGSFVYALNRCSKKSLFSPLDITAIMQGAQVFALSDGGAEVEELCGSGKIKALCDSSNPFRQSVLELMDEMLPSNVRDEFHADESKRSLLNTWEHRSSKASSRRRGVKTVKHQFFDSMIFPRRQGSKDFEIPKGAPDAQECGRESMALR